MASSHAASPRTQIKILRRDETIRRLQICASHFFMTWAADDSQFVVFTDGVDLQEPPCPMFHSRMFKAVGDPDNLQFEDLPGYPDAPMRLYETHFASFWGATPLAVDGRVYQTLTTSNLPYILSDGSFEPNFYNAGVKLIYSDDDGKTWHNQDGSTPVVWEDWEKRTKDNMMFFEEEPEGAFSALNFLQMGQDYAANRDGYVYAYATNGGADGSANQLMLCRVPKAEVLKRLAWEFYAGTGTEGQVRWTRDFSSRAAVHTFPTGWVSAKMPGAIPSGWWPFVAYNEPLGLYMLVASGTGCEPGGGWFSKPNYLGVWVARTPWGPFKQIHEDTAWMPGGVKNERPFCPTIPPKWIAKDGRSFWLTWDDYGSKEVDASREFNPDRDVAAVIRAAADDVEQARIYKAWNREHQLNTGLNMQRVDILLED